MSNETNYFSLSIRKIEGTEKDYELITYLNPCFKSLTEDELAQVQKLVDSAVEDIKTVLNGRVKLEEIEKEGE